MWTAVVVTCPYQSWCAALQQEFGNLSAHLVLVVPDPGGDAAADGGGDVKGRPEAEKEKKEGSAAAGRGTTGGVGSGGATLNAILVAVEHLSAKTGHATVVPELLATARILILHLGPALLPLPAGLLYVGEGPGVADTSLPATNVLRTMEVATHLAKSFSAGVMVCSTDILLTGRPSCPPSPPGDILLYTVAAQLDYATGHGVALISGLDSTTVENILYQPTSQELRNLAAGESVNILAGLVWLQPHVAEVLLKLHCLSPIDGCTYLGVDSGESLLQVSLYYDLLPAACSDVTQADFVAGRCGKGLSRGRLACPARAAAARRHVWAELRPFRMVGLALPGLEHRYLPPRTGGSSGGGGGWLAGTELVDQWRRLAPGFYSPTAATCRLDAERDIILMDTVGDSRRLPTGSIVLGGHTDTDGGVQSDFVSRAGDICGNSGGLVVMVYTIMRAAPPPGECDTVTVAISTQDPLFLPCCQPAATLLGRPWAEALARLGLTDEEINDCWPAGEVETNRCLYTARLFPCTSGAGRMSMREAVERLDIAAMLGHRRHLHQQIVSWCLEMGEELPGRSKYLRLFDLSVVEGWSRQLLAALDRAALRAVGPLLDGHDAAAQRSGQLARILAMTADLLGSMAAGSGGLRSGPARNPAFGEGLRLLEAGRLRDGLSAWIRAREEGGWLATPARLVRTARHYEGGVQLLVRQTVMSARAQVRVDLDKLSARRNPETLANERPELGEPVVVRCPARLDLSGGWTDTPPICYELGGQVVDLAITLDGVKPIGCRAVRIPDLRIEIVLPRSGSSTEEEDPAEQNEEVLLSIDRLSDLADHCNPVARGALVKCCLLAAGLVSLNRPIPLPDQLRQRLGSGLRLELWSELPQGSGLGTSSILAGAVLAACWSCAAGSCYSRSDLVHAVLVVEQLLTTGGGWQDQVGGLHPGFSLGTSLARPDRQVVVTTQHREATEKFLGTLEDRLVVLYTGKPRLAKNLLQNVIRNWYSQEPGLVASFAANLRLAATCWQAVKSEDLAGLGACLNRYWELKRALAPGSEPELVQRILAALRPLCLGASLAGAGGGGFLVAILKENVKKEEAVSLIRSLRGTEKIRFYAAGVDRSGIEVTLGSRQLAMLPSD